VFHRKTRERIEHKLDRIAITTATLTAHVTSLLAGQGEIMADLKDLEAQVKANVDAEDSAILLLQGLAEKLTACASDPAQVMALASQLKGSAEKLGAAIVANTPAATPAPTPPAEPAPPAPEMRGGQHRSGR
jgi:uncharacterized protein YoxC